METARFVLTPFYECMDAIIPLTQLRITNNIPDVKPGRFIGNQMIEFSLQFDHSFLLSESKKHKSSKFDIRAIIRFCTSENMSKTDDHFTLKDNFPIHLKMNLNNTAITLPQFLPNDRSGKDGRRFPRPIDLSEGLLDNPLVINKLLMQWVQDDCKKETYYFGVYLVRRRTCEELTYILLKKQLSPIRNTLNFILEQSNNLSSNQDDDLMLVNTIINTSLICPVSRVRMVTPVRGQHCTHMQCFDCITYLIMNFNKPTWQCPVCDKKTFFCYLEVDSLILGIINDPRSISVNNVVFNKHGHWKPDKKLPGVAADEEPYNDISSYFNPTNGTDNTKSTFQTIPEQFNESNVEKYLQQILQSSNRPSLIARFRPPNSMNNTYPVLPHATVPNRMTTINPVFPDSHNRPTFNMRQIPPVNPSYPNNGAFQDNIRHIAAVTSSMNINNLPQNIQLRLKMGSKPMDPLLSLVNHNSNRAHPTTTQKIKHKSFSTDNSSQIKITNVTSIAKNQRDSNIIVISDDENDDIAVSLDKQSAIKMLTRAQKRPTTVSSVPSNVGSAKSQKLSDNYGVHMSMRSYAASAPSILDSQRHECCCTSNNMCALHREILLRSRMAMDVRPVHNNTTTALKPHEIVDLTQSNITIDNLNKSARTNNHNHNNNRVLDTQEALKLNSSQLHNHVRIPELVQSNRNTVKEFLKNMQTHPEKCYNNNNNSNNMKSVIGSSVPFSLQQRPIDPLCPQMPPDYFQQQWMNMMMSSSQPFTMPENILHQSTQFNHHQHSHHNNTSNNNNNNNNNSNSVGPPKNINSFINQPNAFFNC